jgi:hypothetical protein
MNSIDCMALTLGPITAVRPRTIRRLLTADLTTGDTLCG